MLRKTKLEELEQVMKIIEDGRTFLKEQGINQWQHGEPSKETIINDINEGISYVFEKLGETAPTAMLSFFDEDYEKSPTLWTANSSYLAIHRISTASDFRNQGIAREIMEAIYLLVKSQTIHFLRIDTHLNNKIMRKFLSNFGFIEKEIIKLSIKNNLEDKERIVYELKVKQ